MHNRYRDDRETAQLLILNAISYGQEKGKDVSRYRIGMASLRTISSRSTIRDAFLQDLADQLNKLGWSMATLPNGDGFAIFKADIADSWAGLGTKRLKENGFLKLSESELETHFEEIIANNSQEDEDGMD